jgi:hypothetical protein
MAFEFKEMQKWGKDVGRDGMSLNLSISVDAGAASLCHGYLTGRGTWLCTHAG